MQHIQPKKAIRLWPYSVVAAIAACILLLLVFRFSQETVEEQPVVAKVVEQSIPQPAPQPIVEEKKEEALPEVKPTPQPAKKHRKAVIKPEAPAEPTLAQAEQPIHEQGQDFEPMYAQAEDFDTHYQTIQTVHLSSDVVVYVIEASDMPAATTAPSVSELRARGLLLTNNVQQASQTTVKF